MRTLNRLHLGPDGRFQPAVPRLTHVHTRAHTLAGPRLARVHTRVCMQGPAPAACRPLERCAPGLGRAWSPVPILPPGSRPRTCGPWPSPHPAPRLLPAWGGTAAPLRPLRPAPPGRAGPALQAQPPGPSSPGPGLPISARAFTPSFRGSRGSSGWVSVTCGSSRADVLLLALTTPNVLRRLRPMVSVTAVWRIRGRF